MSDPETHPKVTHMRRHKTSETVQHWRWQRGTAVVLIGLSCWFMVALVDHLQSADPHALAVWLASPLVAITMAALMLAAFVHKHIGLHEIVTDYVHCSVQKRAINFLLDLGTGLLTLATLAAIWHLHLVGIQ